MHDETWMIRTFAPGASLLLVLCSLTACQKASRDLPLLEIDPGGREPRLLSAMLAPGMNLRGDCHGERVLVMVFSHQLDATSVHPEAFELTSKNSDKVITPSCVSLAPSDTRRERRTVYATGVGEADLERVEVIGEIKTAPVSWGQLTFKGTAAAIEVLDATPSLVFGERVMVADSACRPSEAHQAVRVTWASPLDAAPNDAISPEQFSVTIMNHDGTLDRLTPTAVRDDDGDNHHELCLMSYGLPLEVHTTIGPSRVEVLY